MTRTLKFYKDLVDNLSEGVYFVDRERRITYWNRGAEAISGYKAEEVLGTRCFDDLLMHVTAEGHRLCGEGCPLAATMDDGQGREAEIFLHHKDGHRVPVRVRASPIDEGGEVVGAVEVFTDNSARMAILQRVEDLRRMALVDHLTGLANRRYAEMSLRSKLDEMERYGWPVGLLYLDVDHFKQVNDTYGHPVGDRALRMVGKTLATNARSFDLVSRWGGEEFVAILVNVDGAELLRIGERVRVLVQESVLTEGPDRIRVTLSVGATLAKPRDTLESLIGRADELMYRSKITGRNRLSSDVELSEGSMERLEA